MNEVFIENNLIGKNKNTFIIRSMGSAWGEEKCDGSVFQNIGRLLSYRIKSSVH